MNSGSPLRHGLHVRSISPLHRRKVNRHYGMHNDSHSPMRWRNVDDYYEMDIDSISPFRQRNVGNHYGFHPSSISPMRRKVDHQYDTSFDHPIGPRSDWGIRGGRGLGRFQDFSPPYDRGGGRGRGRSRGRALERSFDRPGYETFHVRDEGFRSDPNLSPREGDWVCYSCGNLNFAWRTYCKGCQIDRSVTQDRPISPRRRYLGPGPPSSPPHGPWSRIPDPSPMNQGPERFRKEFDSPPLGWERESSPPFGIGPPPPRHGSRLPEHVQRERPNFRERSKPEMLMPPERGPGSRLNVDAFHERRRYDSRDERWVSLSPPMPLPYRDDWVHDERARSGSPTRAGGRPNKYRREPYIGRNQNDRRDTERMRIETRY